MNRYEYEDGEQGEPVMIDGQELTDEEQSLWLSLKAKVDKAGLFGADWGSGVTDEYPGEMRYMFIAGLREGLKIGAEGGVGQPTRHTIRCPFDYMGKPCGYSGKLADCDRGFDTPNGCRAHGNEERFGGTVEMPMA